MRDTWQRGTGLIDPPQRESFAVNEQVPIEENDLEFDIPMATAEPTPVEPEIKYVDREVIVYKDREVEVTKEVEVVKEVVKEVERQVEVFVEREKPESADVETMTELIGDSHMWTSAGCFGRVTEKDLQVDQETFFEETEVIKEVEVEKEVIKVVVKEVTVDREVIKEVTKEVPVDREVIKEVII